jgi:hypothetical protein
MEHELYDIYTLWHVPFWQTQQFFIALVSIGALILGAFVAFLIRKWRARKSTQTAWDKALHQLDEIKKNNRISVEQGKDFYHDLTRIMKEYVHERYRLDVVSATDQEFLATLEKNRVLLPIMLAELQEVMSGLLFIKFANAQAAQTKMHEDFNRVVMIIKTTIPEEKRD